VLAQTRRAQVGAVCNRRFEYFFEVFEVVLWSSRPIVDYDAADAAQSKQNDLLQRLVVGVEVLGRERGAVHQQLVCIHPVEDYH